MARKTKQIGEELKAQATKLQEIQKLQEEAQAEETQLLEETTKEITEMAEGKGLFCGVILTKADLVAVIDIALKSGEDVTIPFRLYFKEQ